MDELFKDRLARYSFLFAKRNTIKEKDRFLKALLTDIQQERKDIKVVEFNKEKKSASHNVYVGNIRTANHIICTYFDTPLSYVSDYVFFDRENQRKKTLRSIILATLLWLLLGLVFTLIYIRFTNVRFDFRSLQTWFLMIFYAIYFMIFAKISKGNWNRQTLVRNTSSILYLLQMISDQDKNIAYAFLDEGCYGDSGIDQLKKKAKRNAQIYYLDSIGANAHLVALGNAFTNIKMNGIDIQCKKTKEDINYIFASDIEENGKYALKKSTIKNKELNYSNYERVHELLNDCIKGE